MDNYIERKRAERPHSDWLREERRESVKQYKIEVDYGNDGYGLLGNILTVLFVVVRCANTAKVTVSQ